MRSTRNQAGQLLRPYGTLSPQFDCFASFALETKNMHGIIYLVGLVVVVLAILSLLGLR